MKSVKDFIVGEEVFYFDAFEKLIEEGYISQANKKAKMFVPYSDETVEIRVSDCLEYLYKEEDLPDEAWAILEESIEESIEKEYQDCEEDYEEDFNTENSDIVVELSDGDSGLDAVNHIIEYSKVEERPIIGQIIFSDKSKQFIVAVNGIIDSCTDNEDEAVERLEELKHEEEAGEAYWNREELKLDEIDLKGDDAKKVIKDLKELVKSSEKIQDTINELYQEYNKIYWLFEAFKEVIK